MDFRNCISADKIGSQRSSRVNYRPENKFAGGYPLPVVYKEERIYHQSPGHQKLALPPSISFSRSIPYQITSTMSPRQFHLPDLIASCPLKDATNPYYKEAAAESRAWINNYDKVFTDRKRAFFVQGSNELLCSHVYPYAGHEQLRTTCDFVRLFICIY